MSLPGNEFVLFCCILDYGKGSSALRLAGELGSVGQIVLLGMGTITDRLLNILGVLETRKELLFAIIRSKDEERFYRGMSDKFGLEKRHHGIAFSMPIKYYTPVSDDWQRRERKGVGIMDYESIFVIADKDCQDTILAAAEAAGSTGGTIIHGRGSGTEEKATLFNIEIEPEKVIVLILSEAARTEAIANAIGDALDIHAPNAGIIFVMDVSKTLGLYKE